MNTFVYRDARRQKLQAALTALGDAPSELRPLLETELAALQTDDWRVSDRTYLAVGEDWLWSIRLTLKALVDDDPALLALGQPTLLSDAQAAAIETLPHFPGGPPADYLNRVRTAIDNDENILAELLHAAHRRWLSQPGAEGLYPFQDVGVLLPVRVETLFDEPHSRYNADPDRWQLLLRVIPDEASICRHNRHVSAGEQRAVTAFWNAIQQPGDPDASWLTGDAAAIAWQQLSAQMTPPRAAWLVANLPTRREGEGLVVDLPADMPPAAEPNAVGGMPPELMVYIVTTDAIAGATHHHIGRLPMAAEQGIDPQALTLPLPRDAAEEKSRWWASWETAKAVGLGGEWLLPPGVTPKNIDALYVVGIGDEPPDAHFQAQIDAGELGLLPLGAPTNTVHGQPAADLAQAAADWRTIAQLRLRQRLTAQPAPMVAGLVTAAVLTGDPNGLPFFPGADRLDETRESRRMAQALWPALWGHWLRDQRQRGDDAFRVARWAFQYLCPEGPLMPLRISDQPYGLLPVTALSQWEAAPAFTPETQAQRRIELAMAPAFTERCAQWGGAARAHRSIVGKTTEEFMARLGQDALSRDYIWRPFLTLDRDPTIPYLLGDYWGWNALPLVQPTAMLMRHRQRELRARLPLTRFLTLLFDFPPATPPTDYALPEIFRRTWVIDETGEYQLGTLPDSLLVRLLIYACQLTLTWRGEASNSEPEQEFFEMQQKAAFRLADLLDTPEWQTEERSPIGEATRFTLTIPSERRRQLEQALRATLDSAAQRIDPWITGFAWQRLQQHSRSPRHAHRLGVYGWVDGPFDGQPGPTTAGRLHTPSYNQTLAALILRDKFLSAERAALTNDGGRNPWAMNISSRKARLAEEIADEVRMGFHIYEIVGRHVENILGDQAGGHEVVKQVRLSPRYAMRPERNDPSAVCNGIAALQGLLQGDAAFPLTEAQRVALQWVHDALDTYSDLLMADGVLQLVNRQVEQAAATMEAAAGFLRPPSFQFTSTPPSGYQLESVVLATLPYIPLAADETTADPIRLADPSVATFVAAQVGDSWIWTAYNEADDTVAGSVTLSELGFLPHETMALSIDFLNELARRKLGLSGVRMAAPRQHTLAQELVAALGNRPAAGRDFSSDPATQQAVDGAIYTELKERYEKLHQHGSALVVALQAAADDATCADLLRRALIWGVTPSSEPADREALYGLLLGLPQPEDATLPLTLAATAAAVLQKRLAAAPDPAALPDDVTSAPLDNHEARKKQGAPDGIPTLAQAIANLAAPHSKLAILAGWEANGLLTQSELRIGATEATLDENWLTVVATTRATLARLEALQLELATPLTAWTNTPGDPWQQGLIAENLIQRDTAHEKQANESVLGLRNQRFTAAYGASDAWSGEKVAVGLIDAFSEAIPMPQRTGSAAFGFNAPAARAPQAILLAVPPKPRQRLDSALIQQIVAETRQLAHARTARIEDVDSLDSPAPTMWLQTSGPTRVYLEPYPLFEVT